MPIRTFSVVNFEKFQHYKDRTPPWIKLYNSLLENYEFSCLQDASKLHLILIWLLASRTKNEIPCDPKWIQRQLGLKKAPDLEELQVLGFIELTVDASNTLANSLQDAIPEREKRERRERDRKETTTPHSPPGGNTLFEEFWIHYPKKVGKGAALRAWKKHRPGTELAAVMTEAIKRQVKGQHFNGQNGGTFIPNPSTWINQERWKDEIGPTEEERQAEEDRKERERIEAVAKRVRARR